MLEPKQILDRILSSSTLPSFPAVATRIIEMTQRDGEVELKELADVISKDAALSARVLATVNSPFYGYSRTIDSMQQAVLILGYQSLKMLVLGLSLMRDLRRMKVGGFNAIKFWQRSICAASAARVLCTKLNAGYPETLMHAALLMDVGMLALDQALGEAYGKAIAGCTSHADVIAAETKAFGLNHAEVAGALANHWRLPESLALPMRLHHDDAARAALEDPVRQREAAIVALASRCADIFIDANVAHSVTDVRQACMTEFGIDEIACDSMLCLVARRAKELAPLFQVKIKDDALDYEAILDRMAEDAAVQAGAQAVEATATAPERVAGHNERRRAPRFKRDQMISLQICHAMGGTDLGAPVEVSLKDMCAGGIGFFSGNRLEPGTQFVVQFARPPKPAMRLLYEVRRCVDGDASRYHIGAQLQCVLSERMADDPPMATEAATEAVAPENLPEKKPEKIAGVRPEEQEAVERLRRAILAG